MVEDYKAGASTCLKGDHLTLLDKEQLVKATENAEKQRCEGTVQIWHLIKAVVWRERGAMVNDLTVFCIFVVHADFKVFYLVISEWLLCCDVGLGKKILIPY